MGKLYSSSDYYSHFPCTHKTEDVALFISIIMTYRRSFTLTFFSFALFFSSSRGHLFVRFNWCSHFLIPRARALTTTTIHSRKVFFLPFFDCCCCNRSCFCYFYYESIETDFIFHIVTLTKRQFFVQIFYYYFVVFAFFSSRVISLDWT